MTDYASAGQPNPSASWNERLARSNADCSLRREVSGEGVTFVRGDGAQLWDAEGNRWFDLTCGFSATNFGHAYRPVAKAIEQQLSVLSQVTGASHPWRIELAERLIEKLGVPNCSNKVVFNTSGARAVESAWKAASHFRPGALLSISPGYHGKSIGTRLLGSAAKSTTGGEDAGIEYFSAPECGVGEAVDWLSCKPIVAEGNAFPYCDRCALQLTHPGCRLQCASHLWQFLENNQRRISAVLIDPVVAARGFIFPPNEFYQTLQRVASRYGIVTIADEIQSSLGRCGEWLWSHANQWTPDLVVVGKSLAGGFLPISAVVGRSPILEALDNDIESETFAGAPLACRAALEVMGLLEDGEIFNSARTLGLRLRSAMQDRLADDGVVVAGNGAVCTLEFGRQQSNSRTDGPRADEPNDRAHRFASCCRSNNLKVHWTGPAKSRVVLLPPINLGTQHEREIVHSLTAACRQWREFGETPMASHG